MKTQCAIDHRHLRSVRRAATPRVSFALALLKKLTKRDDVVLATHSLSVQLTPTEISSLEESHAPHAVVGFS